MILELGAIPTDERQWDSWAFSNAAHHRDIIRVILRDRNISLTEYNIDPIDFANLDRWLDLHYTMHRQQTAALGIIGYDLSTLDPEDEEDVQLWIQAHADDHIRMGSILNLG
jgi:hypothetical protein